MRIVVLFRTLFLFVTAAAVFSTDYVQAEAPVTAADITPESGQSAAYRLQRGAFYYAYLNNDYPQALNRLGLLRELPYGVTDDNELTVMEATILLSLGLTDDAEQRFRQAGAQGVSANVWFYLARARAEENNWPACEDSAVAALNLIASPLAAIRLNAEYVDEAQFLLVSSRARQQRIAAAEQALQLMQPDTIWAGFARYNLLIARMDIYSPGRELEKLTGEALYYLPSGYEGQALRDRILLVAGIHALDNDKPQQAQEYLSQISLDSAFTAPGLLQYGWSLVQQGQYQEAMQPWRILQQNYQPFHPAVLESVLAVPAALEQLNATTQSLKSYELTEKRLQRMLEKLARQDQPDAIRHWIDQWLAQQDSHWGDRQSVPGDMPEGELSQTLAALLHDPQFTLTAARLHELNSMHREIKKQQQNMAMWSDTLVRRQQILASVNGARKMQQLQQRRNNLNQQIQALQGRLQAEDKKLFAFASASDQRNVQQLDEVVSRVEFLQQVATPTRDLDLYKERWRRARGLQLWRIYEYKPERRWQSDQAWWKLQNESAGLQEQLHNTRTALRWADSSWQGFPQQVDSARLRLTQTEQTLQRVWQQEYADLQQQVQAHLAELTVRITAYLAQTRLAIARLYDDALQQSPAVSAGGDEKEEKTAAATVAEFQKNTAGVTDE